VSGRESEKRKEEDGVYIRPRRGSRGVDPLVYSPLSNALHVSIHYDYYCINFLFDSASS